MSEQGERLVRVRTITSDGRTVSDQKLVASSMGAALDAHAPDPSTTAKFEVEYLGRVEIVAPKPQREEQP